MDCKKIKRFTAIVLILAFFGATRYFCVLDLGVKKALICLAGVIGVIGFSFLLHWLLSD